MQKKYIIIPKPLQIVIDDVGWWNSKDESNENKPYRTGFCRMHSPSDYEAIAHLGRRLHIRPMIAMILCDWDREGILKNVPGAVWDSKNWTRQTVHLKRCEQAADIIQRNKSCLEFTMHGIGHEYWLPDGTMQRAEWYDNTGTMRDPAILKQHLDAYMEITNQWQLCESIKSFVPCAFLFRFGDAKQNFAEILKRYGIQRISTPFQRMAFSEPTQRPHWGRQSGITIMDRDDCPIPWNTIAASPQDLELCGITLGLHWPNLLHQNPERNKEVIEQWVFRLQKLQSTFGRILSKNSQEFHAQVLYQDLTTIQIKNNTIIFDFENFLRYFPKHFACGFAIHLQDTESTKGFRTTHIFPQNKQKHLIFKSDDVQNK
ncbi:MAG: hypothetical protein WCS73_08230 [Lentisphaeria bacterium]